MAAHILGFVGAVGHGHVGMEQVFDDRLTDPAQRGTPAMLSIDTRVQGALAEIAKGGLNFLAIGDFGTGATDQKAVAKAMQDFAAKNSLKPDALLMVGDNFYGATKDGFTVDAPRWQTDIEAMRNMALL